MAIVREDPLRMAILISEWGNRHTSIWVLLGKIFCIHVYGYSYNSMHANLAEYGRTICV